MVTLRQQFLDGGGCPVIEAHGHLGPFYGLYLPEASLDAMRRGMDRRGIECVILSAHNALLGDATLREVLQELDIGPTLYKKIIGILDGKRGRKKPTRKAPAKQKRKRHAVTEEHRNRMSWIGHRKSELMQDDGISQKRSPDSGPR